MTKVTIRSAIRKSSRRSRGSKRTPPLRRLGVATGVPRTVPLAVTGGNMNRYIRFYTAMLGGSAGLGIKACLPLYGITAYEVTGAGLKGVSTASAGAIQLSPVMADTLSPQVQRISSCFSRWRFASLKFTYDPMGSANSGVRMAFAYSNDPNCDQLTGVTTYASYQALQTTPYSRTFSPWAGWSMTVPASENLCYIKAGSDIATSIASSRQAHAGVIACVADANPGATFSYGTLWWEFDLQLYDPSPLATASIPSVALDASRRVLPPVHVTTEEEIKESFSKLGLRTDPVPATNPNLGPSLVTQYPPITSSSLSGSTAGVDGPSDYVRVVNDEGDGRTPKPAGRACVAPALKRQ